MEVIESGNPNDIGVQTHSQSQSQSQSNSSQTQDLDPVTLPNIPQEIIDEILLRLPVKSLIRFKCVSKSWLSLISSPVFVKSHLKFKGRTDDQRLLISRSAIVNHHLKHCSLNSLLNENVTHEEVDVDYPPFESPRDFLRVVGYCDGLFCIVIRGKELYLWNPSTRISKKLPCFRNTLQDSYYIAWGFGYDVVTDDYKVVVVVCLYNGYGRLFGTKVMVYSIKTETWRRIGEFPMGYPWEKSGKFFNGKVHWLLANEDCEYIVSLDLATEGYGLLEKPSFKAVYQDYDHSDSRLHIFEGNLCILCGESGDHIDVWVMNEYGVSGSWCKAFRLPLLKSQEHLVIRPLWISDKGEILLVYATTFMLYNPKDNSTVWLGYWDEKIKFYDGFLFAESLVWPHRY